MVHRPVRAPTHVVIKGFETDFRSFLDDLLVPQIAKLVSGRPEGAVPAAAAQAGVDEARRRLALPERPGSLGEFERVKRLARSVVALCDHCDTLAGIRVCRACHSEIKDYDEALPSDSASSSGGSLSAGYVHAKCANKVRRA
ncbi:DUF6415 family natural product biosynthesis protein [Streptomyces sp. NPDC057623]|uniref:DUF6415 family natural product biosynthesis protein n=1 Tax=Streptomyces sp. NPDC057623 TaxID=3346187 RepID=UPI003680D506